MRRSVLQKKQNHYTAIDQIDNTTTVSLPPSFGVMKKGRVVDLERPSFKQGVSSINERAIPFDLSTLNNRSGLGNNLIIREGLVRPDVTPRQAVDFQLQELLATKTQGIKVNLGDDLFRVTVGDPKDVTWLTEYNRRMAEYMALGWTKEDAKNELEVNPPLGRKQRPIVKITKFGDATNLAQKSNESITDTLETLKASLTVATDTRIPDILAKAYEEMDGKLDDFTKENYKMLYDILSSTKAIPSDAQKAFPDIVYHRYWSIEQYKTLSYRVNAFLIANSKASGLPPDKPVFGKVGNPVQLKRMVDILKDPYPVYDENGDLTTLTGNKYYLDIEQALVVDRNTVVASVNSGVDGGQIDYQDPPPFADGSTPFWYLEGEQLAAISTRAAKDAAKTSAP